jgi:hypothetical protein
MTPSQEIVMHRTVIHQGLILGTLLATFAIAQPPPEKPSSPPSLLERRYKAALNWYDVAWTYYREKRIVAPMLYGASLAVLGAERDLRPDFRDRVAALKAHEKRFRQLESLLAELKRKKIVVSSYDVAAVEYYKLEVENLLEKEMAR